MLALLVACAPPAEEPQAGTLETQGQAVEAPIDPARELVITDVSVVDDARYTAWAPGRSDGDAEGAWSFGRLIDNLVDARLRNPWGRSQFVLRWLRTWERDQVVNGFTVPARPLMRDLVTEPWRAASGCTGPDVLCVLDFAKAPFRLLAIVYRPDLRKVPTPRASGYAGQGRFVFGVVGAAGEKPPFTLIFEYQLPAEHARDIQAWTRRWHALGSIPFGPEYNARLYEVTRAFSRPGALRKGRNGSALLQLRTNEVPLDPVTKVWEMRQFELGRDGFLALAPLANEPDISLNGSAALGQWVARHEREVLAGQHNLPRKYRGRPFLAGAAPVPQVPVPWQVPGASEEVRHAFAMATCSGCHKSEAGTNFLHVRNRYAGTPSQLSDFLQHELSPAGGRYLDYQSLLGTREDARLQDGRGLDGVPAPDAATDEED